MNFLAFSGSLVSNLYFLLHTESRLPVSLSACAFNFIGGDMIRGIISYQKHFSFPNYQS